MPMSWPKPATTATSSIAIVPSDGGKVGLRQDRRLLPAQRPRAGRDHQPAQPAAADDRRQRADRSGPVTSVGYPMNVDRAQGLSLDDIFKAQPPVKSRGFLSGRRPSREFDTILHTAPIGKGSSGGPLLDNCGRVIGVNSFGAESDGTRCRILLRGLDPRAAAVPARQRASPRRSTACPAARSPSSMPQERARAEREPADRRCSSRRPRPRAMPYARRKARRHAEFAIIAERERRD